jgi:Immunity protein 74
MILEVTRGHIRVELLQKRVTILGEMFFPENEKLGFVLYSDSIRNWDAPDDGTAVSAADRQALISHIKEEFRKADRILEVD